MSVDHKEPTFLPPIFTQEKTPSDLNALQKFELARLAIRLGKLKEASALTTSAKAPFPFNPNLLAKRSVYCSLVACRRAGVGEPASQLINASLGPKESR